MFFEHTHTTKDTYVHHIGVLYLYSPITPAEYLCRPHTNRREDRCTRCNIPWVIKLHEVAKFERQTKALTTRKI